MSYLNQRAREAVTNALRDAASVYAKLAENSELPERLRGQFHQERHVADTLADLFETHQTFNVENVDIVDYNALIWDDLVDRSGA